MFGTDLALKQYMSEARFSDFLREAERERNAAFALATKPANQRGMVDRARTALAAALFRTGHWLMPAEVPADLGRLGGAALELRLGQ